MMRAFWWFEENKIAGFARPGFNCTHWFDFPFDEGIVMTWIGQFNTGFHPISDFKRHLKAYTPKVKRFYNIQSPDSEIVKEYMNPERIKKSLIKACERTQMLSQFRVEADGVFVEFCSNRLAHEVQFLKQQGIKKIVSLTENHLNSEKLAGEFDLHHFSIVDMEAPYFNQAEELAQIIADMQTSSEAVGVHCMAGIGRTTTLLVAAHLILGHTMDEMKLHVKSKKPEFQFIGRQAEFLNQVAKRCAK